MRINRIYRKCAQFWIQFQKVWLSDIANEKRKQTKVCRCTNPCFLLRASIFRAGLCEIIFFLESYLTMQRVILFRFHAYESICENRLRLLNDIIPLFRFTDFLEDWKKITAGSRKNYLVILKTSIAYRIKQRNGSGGMVIWQCVCGLMQLVAIFRLICFT